MFRVAVPACQAHMGCPRQKIMVGWWLLKPAYRRTCSVIPVAARPMRITSLPAIAFKPIRHWAGARAVAAAPKKTGMTS